MKFELYKSKRAYKKFVAVLLDENDKRVYKVDFGDLRYEDYTIHKNDKRKNNYLARSSAITDKEGRLTKNNILSPNFWSINLLWNKKKLEDSIRDLEDRYEIKIINKTDEWY